LYFGPDVDFEIVKYNESEDSMERSRIYQKGIQPAFEKLVENIIHTFKFYYTGDQTMQQQQHEVVSFLVEKLPKFKQANGKAFSYFSIVAKNFCILKNKSNYKKLLSHDRLDVGSDLVMGTTYIEIEDKEQQLNMFVNKYVEYWDEKIEEVFSKQNDKVLAYAILHLFKTRDTIELFNKKALYIYIREMSDANTQQITRMVKFLKDKYKIMYNDYLQYGYIPKDKTY
tara:strand:+ start:7360 stop:8040 length:681 start_codon:yes stop_codon:yes gene_type:complete